MIILFVVIFALAYVVSSPWVEKVPEHNPGYAVDLNDHAFSVLICIMASFLYGACLLFGRGAPVANAYLAGWAMEKVLSIDNLIAFGAVLAYFKLPRQYEPKLLRAGFIGAMVFRVIFTVLGLASLGWFGRPMEAIFAVIVAWSAWKMITQKEDTEPVDHENRWYIRTLRRYFFVTADVDTPDLFVKRTLVTKYGSARTILYATPILMCVVALEATDIVFSFDSAPTVLTVSRDPLVVYPAMVFAMLGLRPMYFLMEALKERYTWIASSAVYILVFVAAKLALHAFADISISPSLTLGYIVGILGVQCWLAKIQRQMVP